MAELLSFIRSKRLHNTNCHINHQEGTRFLRCLQVTRKLLLCLAFLSAIYISEVENQAVDLTPRTGPLPGEWRLHSKVPTRQRIILHRLAVEHYRILLIAPRWPGRPWFPALLHLVHSQSWLLSMRADLLSQAHGQIEPAALQFWASEELDEAVMQTIHSARASSTD